jgi:hypothetical protein
MEISSRKFLTFPETDGPAMPKRKPRLRSSERLMSMNPMKQPLRARKVEPQKVEQNM